MFTTAGVGGVAGGMKVGRGDAIFLDANFSFGKEGWYQKLLYDVGDMDKFCLFNIDRGARAKTGEGEREGGGADTVV